MDLFCVCLCPYLVIPVPVLLVSLLVVSINYLVEFMHLSGVSEVTYGQVW